MAARLEYQLWHPASARSLNSSKGYQGAPGARRQRGRRRGERGVSVRIIIGDALEQLRLLPAESVHCCVTSPPYYGLRDYGCAGQIGLEPTPDEYIAALVAVFREVRRVLRPDGTLWVNIGDSYPGAFGAQSRGGAPSAASTLRGNGHVGGGP